MAFEINSISDKGNSFLQGKLTEILHSMGAISEASDKGNSFLQGKLTEILHSMGAISEYQSCIDFRHHKPKKKMSSKCFQALYALLLFIKIHPGIISRKFV